MDGNIPPTIPSSTPSGLFMGGSIGSAATDQATISTTADNAGFGNNLTEIDFHYEQRETSTIVMQCFRLPEELDSIDYQVCDSPLLLINIKPKIIRIFNFFSD